MKSYFILFVGPPLIFHNFKLEVFYCIASRRISIVLVTFINVPKRIQMLSVR